MYVRPSHQLSNDHNGTSAEQTRPERAYMPPVDIWESETALRIVADLPGVRREDLTLNLEAERLQIEARRYDGEHRGMVYKRQFALAPLFDADHVTATLERGVLTVTMPKSKAAHARRIAVTSA
jgi:HSP20 family protein